MKGFLRCILAVAQALFTVGCLGVAFDHVPLTSGDPQAQGATYALAAVACAASAFILAFGDVG